MEGWIKIHRTLMDWEWWDDPVMVKSYIAILLMCAARQHRWRGVQIEPGQFVTSRANLAMNIGISEQQVRTVVRRLVETGEIQVSPHPQYTIITVVNWNAYQSNQQDNQDFEYTNGFFQPTLHPAINQPSTKHQPTTEEGKEGNNIYTPRAREETCLTFEKFWDLYGKKVDKEKCCKRYAKVTEKDREIIAKVLPVYVASTPEVTYRKNPLTWLNGQCWRDEMQEQPDRDHNKMQPQKPGQVLHRYTFGSSASERGTGIQPWEAENA